MTRIFLALSAALALVGGVARAQNVDPAASELVFVTRQMGVPVEGRFQRWSAQVALDPRKPEAGHVVLRIQTDSVSFAAPEVTAEAQRAVWLDTAQYPQAEFRSSGIRAAGDGRFEMTGRLTLKGESHDVTVPVTLTQSGSHGTAVGQFVVKRNDFRVGAGEWADPSLVAYEVQVRFRIALSGLPTS
ncbi:MAG TPA: YceI family protein [Burkholderiaceae bacterium]|nr:YceI family protein [Burkholderiaceae bacterium]